MSDNFKIFFYPRKNYVNKNGELSIKVFLCLNGERAPFISEITTPIELWDDSELGIAISSVCYLMANWFKAARL